MSTKSAKSSTLFTKVYELYGNDPNKWTQGRFCRDAAGNGTSLNSGNDVCWCASGAFQKIYPSYAERMHVTTLFVEECEKRIKSIHSKSVIFTYNDAEDMTFPLLIEILKKVEDEHARVWPTHPNNTKNVANKTNQTKKAVVSEPDKTKA